MENTVKISMEAYIDSLRDDIEAIKNQPENGCCDAVKIKVLENVLGIMNAHFSDYGFICAENKHMAEFLESLGYTQAEISDVAMCGWKPINLNRIKTVANGCESLLLTNGSAK